MIPRCFLADQLPFCSLFIKHGNYGFGEAEIVALWQLRVLRFRLFVDGMSESASFQSVRKSLCAANARTRAASASTHLDVRDRNAFARAKPKCAIVPVQQFQTMPPWSIFAITRNLAPNESETLPRLPILSDSVIAFGIGAFLPGSIPTELSGPT